jgi:hypothetical protein
MHYKYLYPSPLNLEMLKGMDRDIYNALYKHFNVRLMSVLIDDIYENCDGQNFCIIPFDKEHIQGWASDSDFTPETDVVFLGGSRNIESIHMYKQQYIEYTGNESQSGIDSYLSAAYIINKFMHI